MKKMLVAGVHFGHQKRFWNPIMAPYIYGVRQKIHIINLEKTLPKFNQAIDFVETVARNRGKILFVGTKNAASDLVKEYAASANMPYVNKRWLGGMLTNFKTIKQSIKQLKELESKINADGLSDLSKKEALSLQRRYQKLDKSLGGIKDMPGLPDALFVVDVKCDKIAVTEANKLGIPVIGIVDTNATPEGLDYFIPGNDDSSKAIELYLSSMVEPLIRINAEINKAVTKKTPEKKPATVSKIKDKKSVVIASAKEQAEKLKVEKATLDEKNDAVTVAEKEIEKPAEVKKAVVAKKPVAAKKTVTTKKPAAEKKSSEDAVTKKTDEQ